MERKPPRYYDGFRDAKDYGARCHNKLVAGRCTSMTTEEKAGYNVGYDAGVQARTASDEARWLRSID